MKKAILFLLITNTNILFAQGCFEKCNEDLQNSKLQIPEANMEVLSKLVGCKAPDFDVTTSTGERLRAKDLNGKIVVMNFWFAGCAPCIAELPALNKLQQEYSKKDVVFIAFSREDNQSLKEFLARYKFHYKLVLYNEDVINKYCVIGGWPMNLVLDKNGVVRQIFSGGHVDERAKTEAYDLMKPTIEELLKK